MMVSDEEKRWLVVGIAMNKVAAPLLRNFIKQGMNTHYTNMDVYCSGLATPCTLKTLTYHQVSTDPCFKHLKFQNINSNLQLYGMKKKDLHKYNYNINSSVDLAKLFLPDYLAEFSDFDDSLDMSAILRLLGFNKPAPIFHSPNPLISIQLLADDIRENVRNTWGHCNVTDWTEVFFNDCFSKLNTLVRGLGLTSAVEKMVLDQLSDWETKGCQLCMGHAVDQNLLFVVQQDAKELVKICKTTEESLAQQRVELTEMQSTVTSIQDQKSATRAQLEDQMKENKEILLKLMSVENMLTEELLIRVEEVEKELAETDDKVEQLQQGFSKTDVKVEQLQQGFAKVEKDVSETGSKVKELEEAVRSQRMKENRPEACPADMFDVKTCQRKLAEHYQKTAKVPTTAWSSVLQVDLEQIYTRLSWVKQEQTTAGPSQEELEHYTEIFIEKTANGLVAKRILVQGETGIGKTTFVKKLLVDWSNLEEAKMDEERKDALRKFDLVVFINLKEVSKCQTFKEVVIRSRLFPEDDEKSVDDLLRYIHENQDKVLLVFDGYDEYRTGSDAEKRFGSRSSSPIFEVFHGNIFRECTVLATTRISRADEIRVPADIQAEITGFNMPDREDFMRKMLDNQTDVDGLLHFLRDSKLNDLARVPLLSLFFCLLWKSEKDKLMELTKRKAKLYQAIVKHILQHNHRRLSSSTASKLKETDYEEILAEIGKVALAGLLKGDLVFEFGQLTEKVRGEEGVIVGLFQFSEYGLSLEPMEMVSFIHKSIQEYLAAWYLTYSCVPKGSLGEIEQHPRTLENCEALKNVFQFICGLSDEGAVKVLAHLTSVRISDPTLDLSKTIPDVETETEVPVCDVTRRHKGFSNLVNDSFREVQSRANLLSHFLDCTGGVILVEEDTGRYIRNKPLSELIPDVKALTQLTRSCVFSFIDVPGPEWTVFPYFTSRSMHEKCVEDSALYKSLDFFNCLQKPLRVTDSSEVLTVKDFLMKFSSNCCLFSSILCFRNGQFKFYITKLFLSCDDHARVFTGSTTISVPSNAKGFCSEKSCLKFLSSLSCERQSSQTVKGLGAIIGNCKHLSTIELQGDDDFICYLLEQVRSPSKCSVTIKRSIRPDYHTQLTSVGATHLASLLSKFNVIALYLDLKDCGAASKALGRSLPEMSSLKRLVLTGFYESILEAEEMKALFGGFKKAMPLCQLTIRNFIVRSLSPLIKCLRFFPRLRRLQLGGLDFHEHDQCCLLKRFGFLTGLTVNILGDASLDSFRYVRSGENKIVHVGVRSLTPALAALLGPILPKYSSLKSLEFSAYESILEAEKMEALFGGFNKTMPLHSLMVTGFCEKGGLAPLFRSFLFFSNLLELTLEELSMDEHDLRGLLESFQFIPNLEELSLSRNPLGHAVTSIVPHVIHLKKLRYLNIHNTGQSEEDMNYVRDTVQQALPELNIIYGTD